MRFAALPGLAVLLALAGCGGGSSNGNDCASDPSKCTCTSDSMCPGTAPRCDTRTGQCVPCLPANDNCPASQHCVSTGPSYQCVSKSACTANADCTTESGRTGLCCNGMCADPMNDNTHCGSCGNECGAVPNGTGGCINGACGVVNCNPGFGDCDAKPGNGCEADTNTSLTSCGACGNQCKAAPNTKAACNAGKCEGTCNADFADCDGNPANGCETSTTTNPNNCGACGKICPKLPNTTAVACVASTCVVGACVTDFFDCNKMAADGCESDIKNDPANCSGCGRKCPTPMNAAASCAGGNCGVGKCNAGFDDCDKNVLNGCEQDLLSDAKNCGACGTVCSFAHGVGSCQGGKCTLQACDGGWADCDLNAANGCEVNILLDLKNCGQCANTCAVPQNATAACSQGVCGVGSCMYGWADCNNNVVDGCETNVLTVQDCGACGKSCAQLANAAVACPAAACAIGSCNVGFADCDMKVANGCEINITNNANNCGSCGKVCTYQNGVASCAAGQCALTACNKGFGDCNMKSVDGCEQDTAADPKNCGGCGKVCPAAGAICKAGVCDCMGSPGIVCNNACIDGGYDPNNCGACGKVCPQNTPYCANGMCTVSTHNLSKLVWDYSGGAGGCGDFSIWYTQNLGAMTWDQCEGQANKYGATYVGAPSLYAYNAPYAAQTRWAGEGDANNAYITTGSWNSLSLVAKNGNQNCVLGYANANVPGNGAFNNTMVSANGKSYQVNDYGVISEATCFSNALGAGARTLNPYLFANAVKGTAHMVENHSCHGSTEYSGAPGYLSDGGGPHNYRCFVGYIQ